MSYLALAKRALASQEGPWKKSGESEESPPSVPLSSLSSLPSQGVGARTNPSHRRDFRSDLKRWSLARHCRWSARAAMLETYGGLTAAEADERAYREVSREPEPGTEVLVRAGRAGHFALAFEVEPPGAVSLTEALAALTVANEHWERGDDAGCQKAMERLEGALAELRRQGVTAWLVS